MQGSATTGLFFKGDQSGRFKSGIFHNTNFQSLLQASQGTTGLYFGKILRGKDADSFDRTIISVEELQHDPKFIRFICDHIAGMSDQFAAREYMNLYIPDYK